MRGPFLDCAGFRKRTHFQVISRYFFQIIPIFLEIHVRTPGIPRPKALGPRPRRRRPVGGANPCPSLRGRVPQPRMACPELAIPSTMEWGSEGQTKMVCQLAAGKTLPGVTRAGPLAAALFQGRASWMRPAAAPSAAAPRLENVTDAAERPARCLDQGASLVPAGGVGREAASWE